MVKQQLIDWIKSQESRGYSEQQLYNSLIQQGYNPDEVNEAIKIASQSNQQKDQTSKPTKSSNLLLFVIIGVIVIGLIGGGIFLFTSQNDKTDSEIIHRSINRTDDLTDIEGNKVGEINTKIEADIEVTSDCGGMDCFEEKFAECKPATVTSKLMENIIYFYEIIGPKDGLCEVKSKFTANPNPEWVEKEMSCKYDNTKSFETAIQDMSNCQGDLYNLMTGNVDPEDTSSSDNELHINECYSQTSYDRTTCYIRLGETELDLSVCDQESDSEFKWYCYRGVGSGKKDIQICNIIPIDEANNKAWCYERVAFNSEDESLCDHIEYDSAKVYCYERIATKKKDQEICDMIVSDNPNRINICKDRVAEGTY